MNVNKFKKIMKTDGVVGVTHLCGTYKSFMQGRAVRIDYWPVYDWVLVFCEGERFYYTAEAFCHNILSKASRFYIIPNYSRSQDYYSVADLGDPIY